MYNLSRDYDELYDLVCKGSTIVGYVTADMIYFGTDPPRYEESREVCEIERFDSGDINIYIPRDGVSTDSPFKEKEKFKQECSRLNLEWIKP